MTNRIVKVVFRGDVSGLVGPVVAAGKAIGDTTNNLTGASKESEKFRKGLTTLGGTAGKIGLVAAAGLGAAIKASSDFNAQMALVQTLSHASASEMERLSHAALTVGQNIGYSAKAVAQGEEELIKAGVSVKDIMGGALKGSLDLAAAGQTDVATATTIAAAALTQFGLAGKDVPHLADLLAAGADKALGSVEDLGQGLTQVGTTAHQMGLNVEQTVGTLAAFAQAGLIGERGGTTFKQMLLQLAAPTSAAQKLMDKYGISLYNAAGQMKTMPELADNLQAGFGKISPQARNAALGVIFGSRAIQGANILMADGQKGIQDWIDKTNDQGFAAQQASGKLDSLAGDFKKLQAAASTALIGVGSGDQGPLRDLTQGATGALTAFNKLPPSAHNVAASMLAITAITGGGLWFGAKTLKGIAETRVALSQLGLTADATNVKLATLARGGGVVAGVLATLFVAHQLEKDDPTASVKKYAEALDQLGSSGKATSGDLDKLFFASNSGWANITAASESIGGLKDAFAALNASSLSKFGQWGHSLFGTWDTRADLATSAFKKADTALTSMTKEGRAAEAADSFSKIADAAAAAGVSTDDLAKIFPHYTAVALQGSGAANLVADAMTGLIPPTNGVTAATGPMGRAIQESAADLAAQAKALDESRKAARETADGFFGLGTKVDKAKVSLGDWIKDLNKQTAALRDFTKNAQTAGKRGLDEGLIAALEKAGPAGALRMAQLAGATKAQLREANRAWRQGERAVDHYVDVVGGVPPVVPIDVQLTGEAAALAAVRRIRRALGQLPPAVRTDYYVHQVNAINKGHYTPGGAGQADGGTIAGSRWPYGDKVLTPTAPGEEIVSNRHGQADRWRPVLKMINAGMANGGTVGAASAFRMAGSAMGGELRLSQGDIKQLANAMLNARSVYGDAHFYGDDTRWRRQMEEDQQRAGIGGIPVGAR